MGRNQEIDPDARQLGGKIPKEQYELFSKIACRDTAGDKSKLLRKAVEEFNKRHGSGNSVYKIDNWQDPNFKAIPATLSSKETWSKFIRGNMSYKERMELDKIAEYIRKEIDAKNWLDSRK